MSKKIEMSRKGRYRKFGPDFEPEPWYTDNDDSNDNENESITVDSEEVEVFQDANETYVDEDEDMDDSVGELEGVFMDDPENQDPFFDVIFFFLEKKIVLIMTNYIIMK